MAELYDHISYEPGDDLKETRYGKKNPKTVSKKYPGWDFILTAIIVLLATFAAFFPWYVLLNPEQFHIYQMSYGEKQKSPHEKQKSPQWNRPKTVTPSSATILKEETEIENISAVPDGITTTSITVNKKTSEPDSLLPFLGRKQPQYKLLHVVNDLALIENNVGVYVIKIGAKLPDNSILSEIKFQNNRWMLVTSNGYVSQN